MSLKFYATFSCSLALLIQLLLAPPAHAQMMDPNGNGMSDVWEWFYNATNLPPNADADNDGLANNREAVAGTDPNSATAVPKIAPLNFLPTNAIVSMPAQLGKLYQLQSITNLGSTNWLTETSTIVRSGTNFTFPSPRSSVQKFYRVAISDVDTDGDGVNDWEEYKLGLNVSNALSNATQDGNGNAMTDWAYVTNRIANQNVITIQAADPVATEPDSGIGSDTGTFVITRGGFPLNAITVNFTLATNAGCAKEGLDHLSLARSLSFASGVSSRTLTVVPLPNTNSFSPSIAQIRLLPGSRYFMGSASNASVTIYPSPTASGTGLFGQYFTNSSTTYTNPLNFNATNALNPITNRIDPVIDFTWGPALTPNLSNALFTVRWTGQVQPQYSELYYFDVTSDDGCRLWVNDTLIISNWITKSASASVGTINLQAGVRYNLKLEYLQAGGSARCQLNWYSASQSKQVIPATRLYPTNSLGGGSNAIPVITSQLNAFGFVGQPFAFTVEAANTPRIFSATNLPPGLAFNPTNGLISGLPTLAGVFQVPLTASNSVGLSAAAMSITIFDTGSAISRDVWTNIPGISIASIPVNTAPHFSGVFTSLDGITNFGDNYAERLRGYFVAPATANFYFWAAGSDAVQLWISDDDESVNKILRCWVTPTNNPTAPGLNGTLPRQWNLQPNQRSGWLALQAGQKYYFEILHKAGSATNDHWAIGWSQDPTGTNTLPAGITPSYLLARYFSPLPATIAGTLYAANLVPLPGVTNSSSGSATLRVNAANNTATLNYTLNGIPGSHTDHLNLDAYSNAAPQLIYDIAVETPQPDGSYLWNIVPSGGLSTTDILNAIAQGKLSIVINTAAYLNGELGGYFKLVNGTQIFNAPPAPAAWPDDSNTTNGAVRFLTQATFGASPADIASVRSIGYTNWINAQMALPPTRHLGIVQTNRNGDPSNPWPSSLWFSAWWQNAITAPDQLRQRVAFALSQITVVSESGPLQDRSDALAYYYDLLLTNAFGNYRDVLETVTLSPAMGVYLNMQGNDKGDIAAGTHPNENYAREINQLFSIGLYRLWPDGTLVLDSTGNLVPTYGQPEIDGFSAVFTGWNYYLTNHPNGRLPTNTFSPPVNWTNLMTHFPLRHDRNPKLILNNVMLPRAWDLQTNTLTTNYDQYGLQELETALDSIFNHPNVGPFVCRQLIQRLVTSHPSRDYVYRVVQKFNDKGQGVRGDLAETVKAILLDPEARHPAMLNTNTFGKQREPLLRATALARAFPAPANQTGTYSQNGTQTITVTTPTAHRMNNNDIVALSFNDTSGNAAPPSQNYTITYVSTNSFNITMPNLFTGTYSQTNGIITVNISSHGLAVGGLCYLGFTSGGAVNGLFSVLTVPTTSSFTVSTADTTTKTGNCFLPKVSAAGFVQSGTNVTISFNAPHALAVNASFYVPANTVSLPSGLYLVNSVPNEKTITCLSSVSRNQTQSGFNIYPLSTPPLTRSGDATVRWSTFNLGYTDTGSTYNLSQSPLSANTVFNFYFPDYAFPGALATAGLTTPEFQLTSDTSVALQMNFIASGLLTNGTSNANNLNTNGLSSFTAGDGDVVIDIAPWMTTNFTANAGIPALVDNMNSLLLAGQLSAAARTSIINYVTNTANFPYSTPPTATQLRERARAVIHLITASPDYLIQK